MNIYKNQKISIVIISIYPNPHFNCVFEFFNKTKFDIKYLFFIKPPNFRNKIGWNFKCTRSYIQFYKKPIKFINEIISSNVIFLLGLVDPFPMMFIITYLSLFFKKKIFLATEGIKNIDKYKNNIFIRLLIKSVDFSEINCLCIGFGAKEDYQVLGIQKWKLYKYGFFEKYKNYKKLKRKKRKNSIEILSVGRMIRRKNFISVINVLNNCINKNKIIYRIAGEGEQSNFYQNNTNKNLSIKLEGICNKRKLSFLYQNADIFILPSLYDGWGVVVNQAIFFKVPTIVSNNVRSGKDNLIIDNYNGFIYNNNIEFKNKLFILINNHKLRNKFKRNCSKISRQWDVKNVSARMQNIIINNKVKYLEGPLKELN